MVEALQFVGAVLLIAGAIWAGDLVRGGVESALGEKPARDRALTGRHEP